MRSLAARDLISGDEQVKFAVDLQHYWVRKFQRLEWVKEEIRDQIEGWQAKTAAEPPAPRRPAEEWSLPKGDVFTPSKRTWLAVGGAAAILVVGLLLAAVLDWGPFDSGRTAASPTSAGLVVPGGEATKVNDLIIAGEAVWAATDGGVVRWSSDGQGTLISGTAIGFPDDWTQTVVADPDGSLWIGAGGVSHVDPTVDGVRLLAYYDQDDDLGMARVRALMVDDDGTIWASGPFDGESPLSWFDGQEWHHDFPPLEELAQEDLELNIWSLLRSNDGSLWIGLASDGILRWDGENYWFWGAEEGVGGRDLEDARIRSLFEDDRGTLWAAASDRGLLRYRPEAESWERVDASNLSAPVTAIAQFDDGTLWSAGDDWLARSDDGGNAWEIVATTEDGIGLDISGLVQDDAGRVWIGAYDGGVSVWEDGVWQNLQR
jgi:hypothetical protein